MHFKTNHVEIHKSTAFLSIFSLKLQWTTFWNRWCFWRHKLPCNQSDPHEWVEAGLICIFIDPRLLNTFKLF